MKIWLFRPWSPFTVRWISAVPSHLGSATTAAFKIVAPQPPQQQQQQRVPELYSPRCSWSPTTPPSPSGTTTATTTTACSTWKPWGQYVLACHETADSSTTSKHNWARWATEQGAPLHSGLTGTPRLLHTATRGGRQTSSRSSVCRSATGKTRLGCEYIETYFWCTF